MNIGSNLFFFSLRKKLLWTLFLFGVFSGSSKAQDNIDSLQHVITSTWAQQQFDSCELAKTYLRLVYSHSLAREFNEGLDVIGSAKKLNLKQCRFFTELLLFEGSFLNNLNLLDSAIAQLNNALPYAYNRLFLGKIYFVLGTAQLTANHSELAITSLSKATKIFKSEKNTSRLISAMNNLANSFGHAGNYDSCIYYFKQSLEINKGENLEIGPKSASLCELGRVYKQLGVIDSAEYYYDLVLKHGDENFSFDGYASVYTNIGMLKFEKGEYDLAEVYLKKGLKRVQQIQGMDTRPSIYFYLSALAVKNNDVSLANQYMARADTLYLTELKSNRDVAIAEAETKFELSEKELKNKLLAKENEVAIKSLSMQRTLTAVMLSALFLSLIFIWFVWNQRRKVDGLNKALDTHNDELKTLIDDKDNYMSLMAHDLRSPIASIVGLSDLILEEAHNEVKEHTDDIRKSAVGSLQIMNEILDIYRFETGQNDIILESVDIGKICLHVAKRYEPLASAKGQKLTLGQKVNSTMMCNSTMLKSILGNLISNAIKYNEEGGTCHVALTTTHMGVLIEVSDDGPGFSEKDANMVFGKFQKLSAQPTANESSSGLGLYMVKLMVEKLNGSIQLESVHGEGSTFVITLPI